MSNITLSENTKFKQKYRNKIETLLRVKFLDLVNTGHPWAREVR